MCKSFRVCTQTTTGSSSGAAGFFWRLDLKKIHLCLILIVLLTGCALENQRANTESAPSTTDEGNPTDGSGSGSGTSQTPGAQDSQDLRLPEAPEDSSITQQTVTVDEPYSSSTAGVEILGFERYDSLEGKHLTDKPTEGNCYLVLFLSVKNYSFDNLYMNPDDLRTGVDGKAVSNTFLLNDPKGYSSIFDTISAGYEQQGFIVWEVPAEWRELSVQFRQWRYSEKVFLNMTFTPEDYLEAPSFLN